VRLRFVVIHFNVTLDYELVSLASARDTAERIWPDCLIASDGKLTKRNQLQDRETLLIATLFECSAPRRGFYQAYVYMCTRARECEVYSCLLL